MTITIKEKSDANILFFEDYNDKGDVIGAIGFQFSNGKMTIYLKGYDINDNDFPNLKGFRGYMLTKEEYKRLFDFIAERVIRK